MWTTEIGFRKSPGITRWLALNPILFVVVVLSGTVTFFRPLSENNLYEGDLKITRVKTIAVFCRLDTAFATLTNGRSPQYCTK